jgi:hypothetical protein
LRAKERRYRYICRKKEVLALSGDRLNSTDAGGYANLHKFRKSNNLGIVAEYKYITMTKKFIAMSRKHYYIYFKVGREAAAMQSRLNNSRITFGHHTSKLLCPQFKFSGLRCYSTVAVMPSISPVARHLLRCDWRIQRRTRHVRTYT